MVKSLGFRAWGMGHGAEEIHVQASRPKHKFDLTP